MKSPFRVPRNTEGHIRPNNCPIFDYREKPDVRQQKNRTTIFGNICSDKQLNFEMTAHIMKRGEKMIE